jgi:hypothetical protein
VGHWVHSHEEDTGDELVFRPASYPFPPSRGRRSLQLRPDGTYLERAPGPVDVPVESEGSWSLDGDRLVLGATSDRGGEAWRVTAAEGDRLTLRR